MSDITLIHICIFILAIVSIIHIKMLKNQGDHLIVIIQTMKKFIFHIGKLEKTIEELEQKLKTRDKNEL